MLSASAVTTFAESDEVTLDPSTVLMNEIGYQASVEVIEGLDYSTTLQSAEDLKFVKTDAVGEKFLAEEPDNVFYQQELNDVYIPEKNITIEVTDKDVPPTTQTPDKSDSEQINDSETGASQNNGNNPQTGVENVLPVLAVVMVISVGSTIVLLKLRRKEQK